jgi:hypothetical protein
MRTNRPHPCRAEEVHDDREPPNQKKPKKQPPEPPEDPRDKQPAPVDRPPRD